MTTITKAELLDLAKSNKPDDIKRAKDIYQAWLQAAPDLDSRDRINTIEQMLFNQIFAPKKKR